jgi:predicted nucleic acid-binding protein
MANYLLDTTVIIDCLRGKRAAIRFLERIASEESVAGCCLVNIIEVYSGMKDNEKQATQKLIDALEYYDVTRQLAELAGEYKREYAKGGLTLSLADAAIAAVAISNNLILATDNPKHYPMHEIKLEQISSGNQDSG